MGLDSPWLWLITGVLLLAGEILTGAFVLVFFGLAALATATLALMGINDPVLLLVFFSAMSFATLFLLRKKLLSVREGSAKNPSMDVGNMILLSEALPASGEGTISYQGAPWKAVNLDPVELKKGTYAKIVKTEGIKLFVKAEK